MIDIHFANGYVASKSEVTAMTVYPGERVITTHGTTVTVAFVRGNQVWAWYCGQLQPVKVRYDAFGGEHVLEAA